MKTNLAISISHGFSVIGIHLTPTLAKCTEIHGFGCNHSTQFTFQINALWAVTQLLLGETSEN
ncbi:hypothetical protein OFN05_15940 [Acinetobacter baumannii]|nr:hypothetical protein [Acinetobacter baumannii]